MNPRTNTPAPEGRGNSIDGASVRGELERILASKWFAKSTGLDVLLRFLAETAIAGGPPLDESIIASRVFKRSDNFTPQIDPVVRVQYRRLRTALLDFYEAEGCPGSVMLDVSEDGFGLVVLNPEEGRGALRRRRKPNKKLVALVAVVVVAAGAGAWWYFGPRLARTREVAQLDRQARSLLEVPTGTNAVASVGLFERAVELNPGNAPAWSGLADALIIPGSSTDLSRTEALAKARAAAQKAAGLDPGMGQPHAVLGYVKLFEDADWPGAEAEFKRAIQLDPSAPKTHSMYAQGLMSRSRFDEAVAQAKLAASLAPAGSPPSVDLAAILTAARRYDEAIAEARRVAQLAPNAPNARIALGIALSAAGHYDEAIPEYRAAILAGGSLYAAARLGYAYGAKGDGAGAQSMLDSLNQAFVEMAATHWYYTALIFAGVGNNRSALTCLEKAADNHENNLTFIGVEPAFDRLHSDPRFVALKKRFGLP